MIPIDCKIKNFPLCLFVYYEQGKVSKLQSTDIVMKSKETRVIAYTDVVVGTYL